MFGWSTNDAANLWTKSLMPTSCTVHCWISHVGKGTSWHSCRVSSLVRVIAFDPGILPKPPPTRERALFSCCILWWWLWWWLVSEKRIWPLMQLFCYPKPISDVGASLLLNLCSGTVWLLLVLNGLNPKTTQIGVSPPFQTRLIMHSLKQSLNVLRWILNLLNCMFRCRPGYCRLPLPLMTWLKLLGKPGFFFLMWACSPYPPRKKKPRRRVKIF